MALRAAKCMVLKGCSLSLKCCSCQVVMCCRQLLSRQGSGLHSCLLNTVCSCPGQHDKCACGAVGHAGNKEAVPTQPLA